MTGWRSKGLCKSFSSELFHSDDASEQAIAKAICRTCPVIRECLKAAQEVQEPDGVWGGYTAAERQAGQYQLQSSVPVNARYAEHAVMFLGFMRLFLNERHRFPGYMAYRENKPANMPSATTILKIYGGWAVAKKVAALIALVELSEKVLLDRLAVVAANKIGEAPSDHWLRYNFGSTLRAFQLAGVGHAARRPIWSDQQLLTQYRQSCRDTGWLLSSWDVQRMAVPMGWPALNTYLRHFGSHSELVVRAFPKGLPTYLAPSKAARRDA